MIRSAEEFVQLRNSDNPEDYRRAAHDEATEQVWIEVIGRCPEMRSWVAHNKTVPVSVLEILSNDSDSLVRCVVAGKRKISTQLRRKLAHDPDSTVRARVAWNAKTEIEILELLASDQESFVREAAQEHLQRRSRAC